MDEEIKTLYREFSIYKRPEHFTNFTHCEECKEHDDTMLSADLETLNTEHLGSCGWSPFSFLSAEGFAYYMPRILELAYNGALNKHEEPFLQQIIFQFLPSPENDRFEKYTKSQSRAVYEVLLSMFFSQYEMLAEYGADSDMEKALRYWKLKST